MNTNHAAGEVYIVILNWNNWEDTIACLESVFRTTYDNFRVVVCDNSSRDGSLEKIKLWAEGSLDAKVPEDRLLSKLVLPYIEKPIPYAMVDRAGVERRDFPEGTNQDTPLILIGLDHNLGFAGGSNVGIRYALAHNASYVWLLNNDTLICEDALSHLVARFQRDGDIGICGSTLLDYDAPQVVQALGGVSYNKWFATGRNVGQREPYPGEIDAASVEGQMDYVLGASMLISSAFLLDIGLLSEDYFLYFEEADLAMRGKENYSLAYAPESIVYHKGGASIGTRLSSSSVLRYRSAYYLIRNRIRFTTRYFPYALPLIYLHLLATIFIRLIRGQWSRAGLLLKVLFFGKTPEIE